MPLTAATFPAVLGSMRPVRADDPRVDGSYAPWCHVAFETAEGAFGATLYLGGEALLTTPDGSVGLVTFDLP